MNTPKSHIPAIAEICAAHGVQTAILCPGSRCAPLVTAFSRNTEISCHSVVDERSAAFIALGIAEESGRPVVLICTSGSALLNFAPAIAEAFYKRIPLVIISADRPADKIDQQDGQTLRQIDVFRNFIRASFSLNGDCTEKSEIRHAFRIVNRAFQEALGIPQGPVHLNIAFREPLYDVITSPADADIIEFTPYSPVPDEHSLLKHKMLLSGSEKILILAGAGHPADDLSEACVEFARQTGAVILCEPGSNFPKDSGIVNFNEILAFAAPDGKELLRPDIVISFGLGMVSKNLKLFLRSFPPSVHIHIDDAGESIDTYECLTHIFRAGPSYYFRKMLNAGLRSNSSYRANWESFSTVCRERKTEILNKITFSDLAAYKNVVSRIPDGVDLHLANSMAVRYVQIFAEELPEQVRIFCNRGVSGIDGCVSSALGSAVSGYRETWLLCGDLAFQYDSNALWNDLKFRKLRIIIFNNSGGGIFRLIDGPSNLAELDKHFEVYSPSTASSLAERSGAEYYLCRDMEGLDAIWNIFRESDAPAAILEIFTDHIRNEEVFKFYMNELKKRI